MLPTPYHASSSENGVSPANPTPTDALIRHSGTMSPRLNPTATAVETRRSGSTGSAVSRSRWSYSQPTLTGVSSALSKRTRPNDTARRRSVSKLVPSDSLSRPKK